jgi:hypothetical protein
MTMAATKAVQMRATDATVRAANITNPQRWRYGSERRSGTEHTGDGDAQKHLIYP